MFAKYALVGLVPVMALGGALSLSYQTQARDRGRAQALSEARLVGRTAVAPALDGRPLANGLTAQEKDQLARLTAQMMGDQDVLRLRLRDLSGHVVFADDGSGVGDAPDDEALDAARGKQVATLTHLNADAGDRGPAGTRSVEIYVPLTVGEHGTRVGVLEVYLPYAPIERDVRAGMAGLYRNLMAGLALLYVAVFAITVSVSRGLRRMVAANAFMAEHDALTDLPNRVLFHRRAEEALAAGAARGTPVAIAIVDLDRFKEINDTLGHHNGDHLLTKLSARLRSGMREGDTVARLGGDEFGIILRDAADAEPSLQRLRAIVDEEIDVSGLPVSVEASVGYAVGPDDGSRADDLLQRADVAMYAAKTRHAGVLRYDADLDHYDAANLGLVVELRHGIDAGQLVLHYQPKANLPDGRVHAVEALVRWQHPRLGLLPPDRFLPLAEQTDLIDRLTDWVLVNALTEIRDCTPRGSVSIAVNVSARNLSKEDFATRVMSALETTGVPPGRLIIEITETALLADPDRAATTLRRLSRVGVRVSIDDFGKGQTSLGYLADLPVHELKIDKSFVQDMLDNPAHRAIVQSVVDLGHNLSMTVVGEGVETDDMLAALQASGCDTAQGYLLARPMPAEALTEWLARLQGTDPVPSRRLQHRR